jgi:peptide deformylase
MYEDLKIIEYPDPRLKKPSQAVEHFDPSLRALAARMLQLMREARGVGLAAPQVGQNIRLFVMNHTGDPKDDRVYVNPELSEAEGSEEAEEGCLSLPGINARVVRDKAMRMRARDLEGNDIDQKEIGYIARVWQHEFDHLNGTLITDRMGPVAKMAARKTLRELEEKYEQDKKGPDKKKM